jgi:outer membrane protein TolC
MLRRSARHGVKCCRKSRRAPAPKVGTQVTLVMETKRGTKPPSRLKRATVTRGTRPPMPRHPPRRLSIIPNTSINDAEDRMPLRSLDASRYSLVGLLALALSGCASFSRDGGFDTARNVASERLGARLVWARTDEDRAAVRREIDALLARPLTVDDAAQIALLNNRGLQALYYNLGIAEADLVQAGRLQNPRFSTTRTRSNEDFKYETSLTINAINLLTMPLALKLERGRFEAVQREVADEVLRLALETRRAWYRAVGAEESARYYEQVLEAAAASAELARRMTRAGNLSRRDQMREQLFYADAAAQLSRARGAALVAREDLTRLMGLWGEAAAFRLPERLPALPPTLAQFDALEAFAMRERLDIQAGKAQAQALARSLGLTRTTRFINVLELGVATVMEKDDPVKKGYEISIEVPIFDWGSARVARAEAQYMQTLERVAQTAVNARSEVRVSYATYRDAYEVARHYRDEIVPLRKQLSEENVLRYNGMLISVFELLTDAREQVLAVHGYIEALREYWLAQTDLQQALGGRLPREAKAAAPTPEKG